MQTTDGAFRKASGFVCETKMVVHCAHLINAQDLVCCLSKRDAPASRSIATITATNEVPIIRSMRNVRSQSSSVTALGGDGAKDEMHNKEDNASNGQEKIAHHPPECNFGNHPLLNNGGISILRV